MPAPPTEHGITAPGGDPAELRDVAGFLRVAADGFSQVAVNVRQASATVGTSWTGVAASLFAQRVGQTADAIDTAPAACTQAAGALQELALQLEMAQIRALEAQAAAGGALETLGAVGREREGLSTGATRSDPDALRALDRREPAAQDTLATARSNGAGAIGDAQEAARQAAIKLNAAADAFDPPLPPANSEVAPFALWDPEGNGQAGWYQRGRMVFDIKTALSAASSGGCTSNDTACSGSEIPVGVCGFPAGRGGVRGPVFPWWVPLTASAGTLDYDQAAHLFGAIAEGFHLDPQFTL